MWAIGMTVAWSLPQAYLRTDSALLRPEVLRHRIVYLKSAGADISAARNVGSARLTGKPGPSLPFAVLGRAWVVCLEEVPDIQALPEGATIELTEGFHVATGSQRTIRYSTVGRHHD